MFVNTKKLSEIALIFLGICLFVFILEKFQSILRPLAIATMLAFLFTPYLRMKSDDRTKKFLKITAYSLGLLGILVIITSSFISGISDIKIDTNKSMNVTEFVNTFSVNIAGNELYLFKYVDIEKIQSSVGSIVSETISGISSFFSELFAIIIFLVFVIPAINLGIKKESKKKKKKKERDKFLNAIYDVESGIRQYLKVKTIVSVITGILSLIIMLLFGVKYAFVFAVIIFLFNYVPTIGSIFAVLLVLIVELISSGFGVQFVVLGILLIAVQTIMGNFVEPKIASRQMKMSALTVLLSLFFWGAIWGVGGMLFSVPFTLALKIAIKHLESNI